MKAVVNAGPLMALGKLGLLQLLPSLYQPVLIPSDVYEEVVVRGLERDQPDAYAVQLALARGQVEMRPMGEIPLAESIRGLPLHPGEKSVIQLALIETADWALLDDWLARESARRFNLRVKGTLGIIVAAYQQALLTQREVEIIFQSMVDRDDIWISDELVRRVWKELL
jgi:predicted nucleic acid-binding protein